MATIEIPAKYQHRCDGCGASEYRESVSRPPHWSDLVVGRDAYDFQGAACADATVKRLLCEACTGKVVHAINAALTAGERSDG